MRGPRFYSVNRQLMLNGKRRIPSICYAMTIADVEGMKKLADNGLVTLYENEVRFVSGVAREIDDNSIVISAPNPDMKAEIPGEFVNAEVDIVPELKPTKTDKAKDK
jgi:hypothetical protein